MMFDDGQFYPIYSNLFLVIKFSIFLNFKLLQLVKSRVNKISQTGSTTFIMIMGHKS